MNDENFEKRKRKLIEMFSIIFGLIIFEFCLELLYKILYITNIINFDLGEYGLFEFILNFIFILVMYFVLKLSKDDKYSAGIFGIFIGGLEVLLGGIIWKFFGAIIFINSIWYLTYHKISK